MFLKGSSLQYDFPKNLSLLLLTNFEEQDTKFISVLLIIGNLLNKNSSNSLGINLSSEPIKQTHSAFENLINLFQAS